MRTSRSLFDCVGGGAAGAGGGRSVAPSKSGGKSGALELPKRAKTKRAKKAAGYARVGDMDDDDDED